MRRVSVSTALFDGYPLELAIEAIARAGAAYVEPAFIRGYVDFDETAFLPPSADKLDRLIRQAGLRPLAVSAHFDLAAPESGSMLARRIDFAARLGAPFLITNSGKAAQRDAVLATLHAAIRQCRDAGVVLALENPGHGTGDCIASGADGMALVAEIGSEHVRLNYDAGNILTASHMALRPETDIARALPAIAHLHLKDVAECGPDWCFTPLGEGMVDFRALWRQLPPNLPLGIELPLRLRRPGRADPIRSPQPLPLPVLTEALQSSLALVERLDGRSGG
ncbi:MAG: xylose isomerase [Mesorhizobium amorphae]|nr:MAG: xylose isomerase [Mesorhizobium amorphae]